MSMEWSGQQQIQFLMQSVVLGALQGLLLDVITGCTYVGGHRRWLWTDVLFGPLAGLITFFGALIIMDGQLHPVLLIGIFLGMLIEHVIIGSYVCRLVHYIRRFISRGFALFCGVPRRILHGMGGLMRRLSRKMREIGEKQRNLFHFFAKKT